MELGQLRYLIALADEGQFTRAAAREHVAQPALSQQIARLEKEVGMPLVHRARSGSTLTQAGEALAGRARRVLAELDAAQAELAEIRGVRRGRIVIGAMQTLGLFDLVGLLASYRNRYPGVDLLVREDLSGPLAELVTNGRLDLAFLSSRRERPELERLPVGDEELVAMLPPMHPLADRVRLRLADLAEDQFIAFSEGSALRAILVDAARGAGFVPQISVESNELPRIRTMVARGLGVALMPGSASEAPGPPVSLVPFIGRPWSWKVSLAWRKDRELDPPARAFIDLVREQVGDPDE